MAHEDHGAFYESLAARGVTRRDFLKYCGSIAALLGLSETFIPQIAAAVQQGAKLKPAIWINGGSCTGCTESAAQSEYPDVARIVLDILSINYFETIMMAAGKSADESALATVQKGGYIVIYEGSVMQGFDGHALFFGGGANNEGSKTGIAWLEEAAKGADAIIAVGSCAVDGGWVAGHPNPADATGVLPYLKSKGIGTAVINLPTCPVNPEWIVAMVVDVLMLGRLPEMDDFNRPKLIFGQTIHDNCPRRGHFENGEFVYEFGSDEEAKGYCLYAMGCRGPQTFTNCPIVRWNARANWCVESGSPCIGCGSANPTRAGGTWVDVGTPFLNRFRDLQFGGADANKMIQPTAIPEIAGGVVAAGLLAHGLGMAATGRTKGGAPYEEMKAYDKKHSTKGGGK
jgi:hydrogenase small subunit